MKAAEQADVIVVGSGQGGVPLAADMAQQGQKVVLLESGALGGSCINYGCTPSKAFLASAHAAGRARLAGGLGVHAQVRVDFGAVMERVRRIRSQWGAGVERRLERAGVQVIRARASFSGPKRVRGGDLQFEAPLIVLNTGTAPAIPDIAGLAGTPYLTNQNFFDQTELPRRLLVLGGGYIGLELGQGMARLGAEVHILEPGDRLMGREEPDVGQTLREAFEAEGIQVHLGVKAERVEHGVEGFVLHLSDGSRLAGEALLVATGRQPNTAALQAQAVGLELDEKGYVRIDDQFRTSLEGVYAIGDVAGQPQFTHVSWEDYRRLKAIVQGEPRTRNDRVVGYAAFTDPQLGRVGMTLEQAREKGLQAKAVTLPLSQVARATELGQERGFFRLVVEEKSGKILGATFVGYEAGELVQIILAHMESGSTWRVLERSVHIHPTLAEGLPSLARLLR